MGKEPVLGVIPAFVLHVLSIHQTVTLVRPRSTLRQLTAAQACLKALPAMVGPGKPVIAGLAGVRDALDGARPQLVARHASDWMLGQMGRVRAAAQTLGDSLTDLAERDGMTTFDAAFAADAPSWQAWFVESAELVGRAQQAVSA